MFLSQPTVMMFVVSQLIILNNELELCDVIFFQNRKFMVKIFEFVF